MMTGPISEADFQKKVLAFAKLCQWRACHIRPTEVGKGRWATPYQGDPGLPDLILARDGRVILIELKAEGGKLTLDQRCWIAAGGANAYVFRPSDWKRVEEVLRVRRVAAT